MAGNVEQLNAVMRSLTGAGLTDMVNRFMEDKGDKGDGAVRADSTVRRSHQA